MAYLKVSEAWKRTFPSAHVGIMGVSNVVNTIQSRALEEKKRSLEVRLRSQIKSREDLADLPVIQAYISYYKKFKKSYHVLLQLESIALKGRPVPSVNALVEAMFISELDDMLLTAGHDWDALEEPISLDAAKGDEGYTMLAGKEQTLKQGDMFVADNQGVLSSVIYGPDNRTRITEDTKKAFFVVYAPQGIGDERVREHLWNFFENIRLFSQDAQLVVQEVYPTDCE